MKTGVGVKQKQVKSSQGDWLASVRNIATRFQVAKIPSFAEYASKTFHAPLHPWQYRLCEVLQKAIDEPGSLIAIHAPPGTGKSILVSQRFPAYCIGRRPDIRVYTSCYNVTKSTEHTSVTRNILSSEEHREIFPDPLGLVERSVAEGNFSTPARTRMNDGQPSVLALGVKTGITGRHPDILIVDDPYASPEEASSEAINERTLRFFRQQVMGRRKEGSSVVVMFHRYHDDDVAAAAINEYRFDYYKFPAIMDGSAEQKKALDWPEGTNLSPMLPVEWCEAFQSVPENRPVWRAQYQGDVESVAGRLIDTSRFKVIPALPEPCRVLARGYDVGLTEEGDPSVGVRLALGASGTLYAQTYWKDRVLPSRLKQVIKENAESDPPNTIVAVERSTASISVIDDLVQDPFYTHPRRLKQVTTRGLDKWARASGWVARAEEGRLIFVGEEEYWAPFFSVLRKFRNLPTDKDDEVDAMTVAFEALKEYRDTTHLAPKPRIMPGTQAFYDALMNEGEN